MMMNVKVRSQSCHSEFISGSLKADREMLKQVQHDIGYVQHDMSCVQVGDR